MSVCVCVREWRGAECEKISKFISGPVLWKHRIMPMVNVIEFIMHA